MNIKINKLEIIIYALIILLFSLIKASYIDSIDADDFVKMFIKYYIHYGELSQFNIIWITPLFVTIFFITKNVYLKLINFNLRFNSRKNCFKATVKILLIKTILYSLLFIIIQLPLLLIKTSYPVKITLEMLEFGLKIIIEIFATAMIVLAVSLFIKNYAYAITLILTVFYLLLRTEAFYIPFCSLFISTRLNIVSMIASLFALVAIYKVYLHLDITGEIKNETRN